MPYLLDSRLRGNDGEVEDNWIPAFAGMTVVGSCSSRSHLLAFKQSQIAFKSINSISAIIGHLYQYDYVNENLQCSF